MTALWILLGIALFFFLIAMTKITLILSTAEGFSASLRILFLKIRLAPKKEKPPKLRKFRIKAFRKWRLKEEKKLLQSEKKKEKKKKKAPAEEEKEKKKKPKRPLRQTVAFGFDLVRYVAVRAVLKFGHYLKIDVRRFAVTVGGEDPAKTAVTYGAVSQATAYLFAFLERHANLRYPRGEGTPVTVGVDFLSPKSLFLIDLSFSIRIWQILAVGVTALKGYLFDVRKPSAPETPPEETSGESPEGPGGGARKGLRRGEGKKPSGKPSQEGEKRGKSAPSREGSPA